MTREEYEDEVLGIGSGVKDQPNPAEIADEQDEEAARKEFAIQDAITLLTNNGYIVIDKAPF